MYDTVGVVDESAFVGQRFLIVCVVLGTQQVGGYESWKNAPKVLKKKGRSCLAAYSSAHLMSCVCNAGKFVTIVPENGDDPFTLGTLFKTGASVGTDVLFLSSCLSAFSSFYGVTCFLCSSPVNRKFWSNFGNPEYILFVADDRKPDDLNTISKHVADGEFVPTVEHCYDFTEEVLFFFVPFAHRLSLLFQLTGVTVQGVVKLFMHSALGHTVGKACLVIRSEQDAKEVEETPRKGDSEGGAV